jgi:HSP20 family protein
MFFTTTPASHFHRAARYGYAPAAFFNGNTADTTLPAASKSARVDSDDTSVTLSLDVPGLAKEHLTIAIEGDVVRIESKADAPRSFKAAYQLAAEIDTATSQAKLEHGVLTLKLGKLVPVSRETVLAIS